MALVDRTYSVNVSQLIRNISYIIYPAGDYFLIGHV